MSLFIYIVFSYETFYVKPEYGLIWLHNVIKTESFQRNQAKMGI